LKKAAILYLSYDGMTDNLGQSQVLPYLTRLSAKGFNISLISFEKNNRFKEKKEIVQNIVSNSSINWKPIKYTKFPPILSTIWDLVKLFFVARKILNSNKIQIIHCRSYVTMLVGMVLAPKYNVKCIFDMRGFWADERIEGGIWNLNSFLFNKIYQFFKFKEQEWIRNADGVVVLTHKASQICEQIRNKNDVVVVPCSVDIHAFENVKNTNTEIRKKIQIYDNQIVIGYLGSMGTWYLIDEMLKIFKQIKIIYSQAVLVVYTSDSVEYFKELASKNGLSSDEYKILEVSSNQISRYISIFDLTFCFIKKSYSKQASSPTKLGELLAAGIPVICNAGVGDIDYLQNKYTIGYLLNDFNESEVQKMINLLPKILKTDKNSLRNTASLYFNLENAVLEYENLYKKLIE
jgi:glycosyltransferase involved in cell wall biosynthesis